MLSPKVATFLTLLLSIERTAISVYSSLPSNLTSTVSLSDKITSILSAEYITWWFVSIYPLLPSVLYTNPDPLPIFWLFL